MRRSSAVELALVTLATGAVPWLPLPVAPSAVPAGQLVAGLAALLLAQGLVRDLALLWRQRGVRRNAAAPAPLLCVESALGGAGVLAGVVLMLLPAAGTLVLDRQAWTLAVGVVLLAGFAGRDLVIAFRPFGVRIDPDHYNLVVGWRRGE